MKLRTIKELQEIIDKYPNYTKKDFRGEGKLNSKKILTRKETERPGLIFGFYGKRKQLSKEVLMINIAEKVLKNLKIRK